jgi:hypothetical protein
VFEIAASNAAKMYWKQWDYLFIWDRFFDVFDPDDGFRRRSFVVDRLDARTTFQEMVLTFLLVVTLKTAVQLEELVVDVRNTENVNSNFNFFFESYNVVLRLGINHCKPRKNCFRNRPFIDLMFFCNSWFSLSLTRHGCFLPSLVRSGFPNHRAAA